MKKVLCAHQGAEMYGSDRSFLLSVSALKKSTINATVDVVLPEVGPLYDRLQVVADGVKLSDLVKVQKRDLKFLLVPSFLRAFLRLRYLLRKFGDYDVVYVNTVVVLDCLLAMGFWKGNKVVHVREIPTGLAAFFFSWLVRFTRATVFFNSQQTAQAFRLGRGQKGVVIHNGTVGYSSIGLVGDHCDRCNVLLIGRINSWKGQGLLIDAVEALPKVVREKVSVRIVGSPAVGQEAFLVSLQEKVERLRDLVDVEIVPFSEDPSLHFEWADVVTVPSTKPEPFGLVAIEAMSAGRPVVAAAHGGLVEIVEDGATGLLFEPGSAEGLAAAIERLYVSPGLRRVLGEAGRARFVSHFSNEAYAARFVKAVCALESS